MATCNRARAKTDETGIEESTVARRHARTFTLASRFLPPAGANYVIAEVNEEDLKVVYAGEDVRAGQKVFLKNGLMQYGSVFGHGGYLGPDYTADYLRRSATSVLKRRAMGEGSPTGLAGAPSRTWRVGT